MRTQSLKILPKKAWDRSVYCHACYAYCQGFLSCLFLHFRSIHLHFFKTSPEFSLCWLWLAVPAGSPSRGGDVKVCVFDINQPSLPTPITLFLRLFLSYGPFTCVSFHKFSRQLSVFALCSPSLISAFLVLSAIYIFLNVSLNGFGDPARLPCAATRVGGERDPGD